MVSLPCFGAYAMIKLGVGETLGWPYSTELSTVCCDRITRFSAIAGGKM